MTKRLLALVALVLALVAGSAIAQTYYQARTTQALTFGCLSSCTQQNSAFFGAQTNYVRIVSTNATGYVSFAPASATPIVTAATGIFLPVNVPEIFKVPAGSRMGILAHSTTGSVWITELSQ